MATRRGFILGLTGVFCAPAIVRASSLMPVSRIPLFDPNARYSVRVDWHQPVYAGEDLLFRSVRTGVNDSLSPPPMSPDWVPPLRSPRMSVAQIERWNRLRAHTGMVMTVRP